MRVIIRQMKQKQLLVSGAVIVFLILASIFIIARDETSNASEESVNEQYVLSEDEKLLMRQYDSMVSLRVQLMQLLALDDTDPKFTYDVTQAFGSIMALFQEPALQEISINEPVLSEEYKAFMATSKSNLEKYSTEKVLPRDEVAAIAAEATNLAEKYRVILLKSGLQLPSRYLRQ